MDKIYRKGLLQDKKERLKALETKIENEATNARMALIEKWDIDARKIEQAEVSLAELRRAYEEAERLKREIGELEE